MDNPGLTSYLEKAAFLVLLRPIEPPGARTTGLGPRTACAITRSEIGTASVRTMCVRPRAFLRAPPGLALHLTLTGQGSSHFAVGRADRPEEELRQRAKSPHVAPSHMRQPIADLT